MTLLMMGRPWLAYGDVIEASRFVPYIPRDVHLVVDDSLVRLFGSLGHPIEARGFTSIGEANRQLYDREGRDDVYSLQGGQGKAVVYRRPGRGAADLVTWPWSPLPETLAPAPLWASRSIRILPGRIGLCWTGSRGSEDERGLPMDALAPLTERLRGRLIALHLNDHAGARPDLVSLAALGVRDWADTAGVIKQLDLVITADTAIAHLAGSLGVPTWLLIGQYVGSLWWWGDDADTVPWYPSLRIFRQRTPGDWTSVIDAVRAELARAALAA